MLIISKKKDYYDGVVGSVGVDKTIVYERKYQELEENDVNFPEEFDRPESYHPKEESILRKLWHFGLIDKKKYIGETPIIVGFCGKLYIGWKFHKEIKTKYHYDENEIKTDFIYDYDEIKNFIEQKSWNLHLDDIVNDIINYNAIDIFRRYNTPIFVYDYDYYYSKYGGVIPKFYVNPRLKDFEFYKVFDTFTAFQEIQMFISGVLGSGEKEIVEVEDKHKISQHGFDKWSFRKEPTKKK